MKLKHIAFFTFLLFFGKHINAQQNNGFYEFKLDALKDVEERQLVFVGTRTKGQFKLESPVPIDIITSEELKLSPQIELSQILTYLIPSFNGNHQTIADGTDHIVPASIRGLGPDQILVLINGKRWHSSALVNVNGTFGRGAVSTDFDAIPVTAIERIELLRDGASAQYGSDAIAGVINIILKSNQELSQSVYGGITQKGDGMKNEYNIHWGLNTGLNGNLNITGELSQRGMTDRSGTYTGTVYHNNETDDNADTRLNDFDRNAMNIGNAQADYARTFFNLMLPFRTNGGFYSFGGLSYRNGLSTGFYRFPKEEEKVVAEIYPDGFLPEIHANTIDKSLTAGIRQKLNEWNSDISFTYGSNLFDFNLQNTNNASMGVVSPTSFYCGGFFYSQTTMNFDISRTISKLSFTESLNFAMGTEYRTDNYRIIAGDEGSYIDGGVRTADGRLKYPGAQLFSGIQPDNEVNTKRNSFSAYLDIESNFSAAMLLNFALRYEKYNDFGRVLNYKLAGRYKLTQDFFVRATASTGFRAPSVHQLYLSSTSTQIIDNESRLVATFNNFSKVTKAFGIPELTAEKSMNLSTGLTLTPGDNFIFTTDYYDISIKDRIVLSGRFNVGLNSDFDNILNTYGVHSAQFFTNAVDTRSQGVETTLNYKYKISNKRLLHLSVLSVFQRTKIVGKVQTSDELNGMEDILFNREERSRIENGQPAHKVKLSAALKIPVAGVILSTIRFGEVKYVHPIHTGQDQTFTPKWITDVVAYYNITSKIRLSAGGNNLFNVYPDKHTHPENINFGRFVYSRRVSQFGFNGAYYFVRFSFAL